jgi:hypothetical protein
MKLVAAAVVLLSVLAIASATGHGGGPYLQLWGAGRRGGRPGPKLENHGMYCPKDLGAYTIKCIVPGTESYKPGAKGVRASFYVNGALAQKESSFPFYIAGDNWRTGYVKEVRSL